MYVYSMLISIVRNTFINMKRLMLIVIGIISLAVSQFPTEYYVACRSGATPYNTSVILQIYTQGLCYCPYGTFQGQGATFLGWCVITNIIPGCVRGLAASFTSATCTYCGYGLTLDTANTCTCLKYAIPGGCTADPGCTLIIYSSHNTSSCQSCAATFTLVNGQCICAGGLVYDSAGNQCLSSNSSAAVVTVSNSTIPWCLQASNSTTCAVCGYGMSVVSGGGCECTSSNVTGGCTSIPGCSYVSYRTPTTAECIACSETFTLVYPSACVCSAGSYYSASTGKCSSGSVTATTSISGCVLASNETSCAICGYGLSLVGGGCVCLGSNITGGCSSIPGCTYVTYPTPTTAQCISCGPTFTLIFPTACVCPTGTYFNSTTTQCTSAAPISTNVTAIPGCLQASNATNCMGCGYGLSVVNGSCVCLGRTLMGGCTSIEACTYVSYPTPTSQQCIACTQTFTLLFPSAVCVCLAGTYFNPSLQQCQSHNTAVSLGSSSGMELSNSQLTAIMVVIIVLIVLVFLLVAYLLCKTCSKDSVKMEDLRVHTQTDLKDMSKNQLINFKEQSFEIQPRQKYEQRARTRKQRKTLAETQSGYNVDEIQIEAEANNL